MINKDRIVPITRTDLLSFFATILRATGEGLRAINVVDGVATIPEGATGNFLATEPVKKIVGIAGDATVYFCPAYDFEMTMTPEDGDEFEANPGDIYELTGSGSATNLSNGDEYTLVNEGLPDLPGDDEGDDEGGNGIQT